MIIHVTIECIRAIDYKCQMFVLSIIYTLHWRIYLRCASGCVYRIYIYNCVEPLSVLTSPGIFSSVPRPFFPLVTLNDRKRGKTSISLFTIARGNSTMLLRKELRSTRMTRLFTIHINRVGRRRSGGEKNGYTRSGPLHLACNAYVVTAMCHSRRAGAARAKARAMNIYPRLLQNKCWYRETRAAKEQQKETRIA